MENRINKTFKVDILFKPRLYYFCYYFLAGVLIFSGLMKVIDPIPMMKTITSLSFINKNFIPIIGTIIPVAELILGAMFILKIEVNIVLIFTVILFGGFLAFAVYGKLVEIDISCGCFGILFESNFNIYMIIRNILLFLLSSYTILCFYNTNTRSVL